MSSAGWYPDPGKQPGMYRWWDGQTWSAALSPNPNAAPPHGGLGAPVTGPGTAPITTSAGTSPRAGAPAGGTPVNPGTQPITTTQPQPGPGVPPPPLPRRNRGGAALWIGAIAGLVAVVVIASIAIRAMTGGNDIANTPSGNSTRNVCPAPETVPPSGAERPTRNGRVYGGQLSYPTLSPPWSSPSTETRVPFGRNAWTQTILVERYGATQSWVASVLVAELNAGDGFYTPQRGSEIVVQCIVGAFYGDSKVDRKDRVNRATTVQGKEAWLVESQLTFNIPNLQTKGELAIVLIVQTSENRSSIFYASIPDTTPQWEAPARQAMAGLAVDG
ncbi:DUF2510 domain-containing protein [Enemella evansiae]|uniref:DUF2510 domain-containing protein n=1 Tax=Enemella evansiae TaxID=2016499 RepID=UPI001595309C|nr:DUF2510 domain-containing protein [Enemella evansiae]